MNSDLKNSITSLPCKDVNGVQVDDIVVRVKNMTWEHVNFWHTHVQPIINSNYRYWAPGVPPQDVRADVGWDWARNYALALLHSTARYIPRNRSGVARAYAIVALSEKGNEIPIGMLTVVPEFNCRVQGVTGKRTFAWYLADAPKTFYCDVLKVDPVMGVASALIDTAIQSGMEVGADGAVLLHADPNGGQRLADFYLKKCDMMQLALSDQPVSLLRRKNINQYFFMNAIGANAFAKQFDGRR